MTVVIPAHRAATILVVDARADRRCVVTRALRAAGFHPRESTTGADALGRVDGAVDLVVLGEIPGDVDAMALCHRLRSAAETRHIPIVQLATHDASAPMPAAPHDGGADAYLTGPLQPMELVALANALLRAAEAHWSARDGADLGRPMGARRPVDESLRASPEQLQAQYVAAPVPSYTWRAAGDDFVLIDFNTAAYEFTHGKITGSLGVRATEIFAANPIVVAAMHQSVREGRRIAFDSPYTMWSTGERKELAFSFAPVPPDIVLIHTIDETDRRAAEQALRARERRFRALTENTTELVAVLDVDMTFQYASPGYERVLGHPPAALEGAPALPLVHPDDVAPAVVVLQRLRDHPGSVAMETLRVRHRDGSYRTIEFRGESMVSDPAVGGILVNGRDVTESRRASAELRFRASLLDAVEQAVIATTLDGTITYWNRFAERLYGWNEREVRGRRIVEVLPHEVTRAQEDALQARLAAGESWCGEFEVTARDGRRVSVEVTDSPIFDAAGTLIGVVGVAVDVSEKRALEAQLRQAQKLEAVGKLAGGVAHDFNNLLTVIRGSNEFVADVLPPDSPAQADVDDITAAVDRAAGLTRQLLAFSRKQMLTPRMLDLNVVVRDVERMLARLIGEDITLRTSLDATIGAVLADRGQIEQVLVNLVVNARDAMPKGGTLTITTSEAELEEGLRPRDAGSNDARYVLLSVRDTGHGMDRHTLEHAFEPFFTTREVGGGTGLGLATVYGIVRQSGGHIVAHSEPGAGAELRMYLPRREPVAAGADGATIPRDVRGTGRILLVEDEEAVRRVAWRVLERLGYSVIEAPNGRVALERFRDAAGGIDLVVTDTVMPEVGGRELVEELRRQCAGLPALYMSGYTDDVIVRRGVDPSSAFLQKPFSAESFGAAVREALERGPGDTLR